MGSSSPGKKKINISPLKSPGQGVKALLDGH